MTLKFYYDLISPSCRAVYVFLKQNKITFEPILVNLGKGEQKSREYKKINPLGLVPTIDDNGFILRESVGILRYLCRRENLPDSWYPRDSKAQARVDEFLEWQHNGLRVGCSLYFFINFAEPRFTKKSPLESDLKRFKGYMIRGCDAFENYWLNDSYKFLFGDEMSIADVLAAAEFDQPRIVGYDPRKERPKLAAYMDLVKAETSPYYEESNVIVEKLIALAHKL